MKAIKFEIKAKQGMLKNPLTSRGVNLTYTNLHVNVLKGIIGATLGFDGKLKINNNQQSLLYQKELKHLEVDDKIPENILKLEGLNYSLITHIGNSNFIKKVYNSTNTIGINYSYEKQTVNTILNKNEILENIHYTIYIYEDSPYYSEIKDHLLKGFSYYHRYLGKNQFTMELLNIEEVELRLHNQEESFQVKSLFKRNLATLDEEENDYLVELKYFSETLPSGTDYNTTLYKYDDYLLTNSYLSGYEGEVYADVDGQLLVKLS